MTLKLQLLTIAVSAALLTGCNKAPEQTANPAAPAAATQAAPATAQTESAKANAFFDQYFMDAAALSPMALTQLGIKQDYDKWDQLTDEQSDKELALTKKALADLAQFDVAKLDTQTTLSYQLFKQQLEQDIANDKWRYYNYPVNQMFGMHSGVPSLLINQHLIDNEADAKAYIARLNGIPQLFKQLEQQLSKRAELGIIPPKFVFPLAIAASQNIIKGAPFSAGADSTLLEDFRNKVNKLTLDDAAKQLLVKEAEVALTSSVKPAYESLIAYLTAQEKQAGTDDGVWRSKDGEAFYKMAL